MTAVGGGRDMLLAACRVPVDKHVTAVPYLTPMHLPAFLFYLTRLDFRIMCMV